MKILGLSGGFDYTYEQKFCHPNDAETEGVLHDSSAAIVIDGKLVCAIEEERLNRIKHTNKLPVLAAARCLNNCSLKVGDIDLIAIYETEEGITNKLRNFSLLNPEIQIPLDAKTFLSSRWSNALDTNIPKDKFIFIEHHHAHALLSYVSSGFRDSLVLTLDGAGDFISGSVSFAEGPVLSRLATFSCENSLGLFYSDAIRHLGYRYFDEYKVMGLAPLGDARVFRDFFSNMVHLLPNGQFSIDRSYLTKLNDFISPRKSNELFTQAYSDLAAGIQETLEIVVLHVLHHYKELTKSKNLCLSGGVALNCVMNGKIARSNLFDEFFIPPAPHDAGCSVGAALAAYCNESNPSVDATSFRAIYLGANPSVATDLKTAIYVWESSINVVSSIELFRDIAQLLASGAIVGWVSGRSEFGPRALGARSILASPQESQMRDRINLIIKEREDFRPLAPSVLKEFLGELFVLPSCVKHTPFMSFALPIREEWKDHLKAVCHVDGTARVQSVDSSDNPEFWNLIKEFQKLTGIPALLNTSFNLREEPIVETTDDAIACFLTSEIDVLAIGNFIITRKKELPKQYIDQSWIPYLPSHVFVSEYVGANDGDSITKTYWITNTCSRRHNLQINQNLYQFLSSTNGVSTTEEIISNSKIGPSQIKSLLIEIWGLWKAKRVIFKPKALK